MSGKNPRYRRYRGGSTRPGRPADDPLGELRDLRRAESAGRATAGDPPRGRGGRSAAEAPNRGRLRLRGSAHAEDAPRRRGRSSIAPRRAIRPTGPLGRRILRELNGPRRLRPGDAVGEIDILRALAMSLTAASGKLLPLEDVQAAFSARSRMLVTGDFAQGPLGTLVLEAAGGAAGQFDQFLVGGAASLGGKLEMRFIGGYVPLLNDLLNPMGFASATGTFASISSNAQLEVTPNGLRAVLDPAQAPLPGSFPIFVTDARRLEGGNFLLRGKGQPASRYTIEASISPADFRPIETITAAPDGSFEFQDVNAPGFAKRFYRAVGP